MIKQPKARRRAKTAEAEQGGSSGPGAKPKKSGPQGGRPKPPASRRAIAKVPGIPDATRQRLLEAPVAPPPPSAPAQPALPTPPAPKPMFDVQYKPRGGLFSDECWVATTTKEDGQTTSVRWKRVIAGVALPKPDQPQGAVVVLAQLYQAKPGAPPAFTALAARVGPWVELEYALGELRRRFLVRDFIAESEEAAEDLGRVPAIRASGQLSAAVLPAPAHALREASIEVSQQRVNALLDEGRLQLRQVQAVLEGAADPSRRALLCVIIWALEHPATYKAGLRIKGPSYGWTRPQGEIQRPPFDRGSEE